MAAARVWPFREPSMVPRMRWTAELQQSFVRAVDCLGDQDSASTFLPFHGFMLILVRR
jgi:hypothetical protein